MKTEIVQLGDGNWYFRKLTLIGWKYHSCEIDIWYFGKSNIIKYCGHYCVEYAKETQREYFTRKKLFKNIKKLK